MDFEFSEREEVFRKEVRAWLETSVPDDLRGKAFASSRADVDEVRRLRGWQKTMWEAGYVGMNWPREFGGRGAPLTEQIILFQEMARAESPQFVNRGGLSMLGPTLMKYGTPAQQARHLQKILTADELWCQGFSEPNAGSDLANLQTRGVLDGDHVVVYGQKVWTSMAHVIAIEHAARLQIGEVGARVGLGEALTPELVGGQDLLQMPGLLGRRAVFHQRRAEHRQPAAVHELGRLGARHLLEQDDLLGERRAAAAELPGPVHADITGLPHRLLPAAQPPHLVDVGARRREGLAAQIVRHAGLEPRPNLLPKHLLPLAELEIHLRPHAPRRVHRASSHGRREWCRCEAPTQRAPRRMPHTPQAAARRQRSRCAIIVARLLPHDTAAIDHQRLPRDISRLVGREEHGGIADVLRRLLALHRHNVAHPLVEDRKSVV